MSNRSASEIREGLPHPVVDADGHTVEFMPALEGELLREGVRLDGSSFARRMSGSFGPQADWHALSPGQRARQRVGRGPWMGVAAKAIDMATALLPSLLYERLDELGIDVSIVYPSYGLLFPHFEDESDRRGACRALNRHNAEVFGDYTDRLISVAAIPMHTPEEAIEGLEHAASLGFRAAVLAGFVQRPTESVADRDALLGAYAVWTDTYGIDSPYDYDPVWAKCAELGIAPSFHSGALGWQNRTSISSYVYNHVGQLGESHHALAKSLFLGGVTRRFPNLNFAFLEGGAAWAASLYADLLGHWEKRNAEAMRATDPARADWNSFAELFRKYGGAWADRTPEPHAYRASDVAMLDEFAACGIEGPEDIRDLFVPRFYAGCEADDPMTSVAFNTDVNPMGVKIQAMLGSDISHWDVPDMVEVLPEAWEMVEGELLSEDDFADFAFNNVVRFYTEVNQAFFEGTRVESDVAALATGS
jgi:predicted TIM-barrel fold metal-dependent hydrolase